MSIGKNIAKFRKALNLTQEELGQRLGVTNQAVSKWESEVSMPDIMLLPQIAAVLGVCLEDIYGIAKQVEQVSVNPNDFPVFCHNKLHELFFHNSKMRFTHIDRSDEIQLEYQKQKLKDGCRIGCLSNTQGAFVMTDDFALVDCSYKSESDADILRMTEDSEDVLRYLSDRNVRKVLFYQYVHSKTNSKEHNTEFTAEDIECALDLSRAEVLNALKCLEDIHINEVYTDRESKTKKYVLKYSTAIYALAICKLGELLSESDPVWIVVRDTSMIDDYAM